MVVSDPWASPNEVSKEYGISTFKEVPIEKFDAAILAVGHEQFQKMDFNKYLKNISVLFDVKGILDKEISDGRL